MAHKHTITIFLDEDGYTAYFTKFAWISAGGNTEEAIKELGLAFKAAKNAFPEDSKAHAEWILTPIAAHG